MTDISKVEGFICRLREYGFTHVRLCVNSRKSQRLGVECQKLKYCEYGRNTMYILEAAWEGEYCCAYASSLEDWEEIIRQLKETAGTFGNRELPEDIKESKDFRGKRWRTIDREAVAESLRHAEREALACEKAHFVEMCEYQQYEESMVLVDEHMHYLADDDGSCTFTVRVVAKEGDSEAAVTKYGIADRNEHVCEVARRAAQHAVFGLHGEKLASGSYPIVLENCVMAELTGHYLSMFYGENIRHHASALAGKEHKQVGCASLCIEEDPSSSQGTRRRRIDDEGIPVTRTVLLNKGVFENVLYSRKSAADAGAESTGNGFKSDVTADIGTGATNILLSSQGDVFSRSEMLEASQGGIYITKIEGMFAGADTESGNFSLLASGNRIVDGKVGTAVNQFTISGNICELWRDIEMIGDDPVYRMSEGTCVVSPSVKVRSLMVSGQ
jgi:PmbA protein